MLGTPWLLVSQSVTLAAQTDANPNPETTMPAIIPVRAAGNHLTAGGVAEA